MSYFFENISHEDAEHIDRMTKLAFELRENRLLVLEGYGAADEAQLKLAILDGAAAEHPAYEAYLSASILNLTKAAIRSDLDSYLRGL
ncbi:MAG: hypothetical protein ACYC3O_04050 [Burkholderiales bacterium]